MRQTKSKTRRSWYSKYAYLFLLPFFVTFLVFQLYPMLYTIWLSFTDLRGWATDPNFVGIANYQAIVENEFFKKSVSNTFVLWTMNFIPQLSVALLLAALFTNSRLKLRGSSFFKTVFYLPNIITAASVALIFFALFGYPFGPINVLLQDWGLISTPIDFFRSPWGTRVLVAFIQFWMFYGSTMIVLIAGISGIDTSLYEAATIDGANANQIFWRVTLPLLRPIMLYTLVTSLIGGMQIFDIPFLLTAGGPQNSVMTMAIYIYNQAFTGDRNFNVAATASVVLLLICAILSAILFRLLREKK